MANQVEDEKAESGPEKGAVEPGNTRERTERSETAYPYYPLAYAITVMQAVRKVGGSEASSADVMQHLAIAKVTDRKWAFGVPAATQFGLIERIGRGDVGRIKVTDLGKRVALPGTPEEERAAKVEAFKTPELYAALLQRFAGAQAPSKDGLKNILHRDYKIVESMAPTAAEAFLESLKDAGLVNENNVIAVDPVAPLAAKPGDGAGKAEPPPADTQAVHVPKSFVIYKCKIGGGKVIDIPLPSKFTRADFKRLQAFLETQVDDDEDPVS